MCFCHSEDFRGRIDGCDMVGMQHACSALGEYATAAADVEVFELPGGGQRVGLRGVAGADEVVAERVHEMEEAGGAMGVPPGGREGVEVLYFLGVDGGLGALRADVEMSQTRRPRQLERRHVWIWSCE